MHDAVKKERRERRKAEGMNTDSEDTDPEEGPKGEMNNFQDLQLGSITPLVCFEDNSPRPYHLTDSRQDMNRLFTL